ncbi:MAG TPA: toprim domain-containing protein [Caulobacter sp.]|nr:toprim domain-containing protein [Caulobacter sp.]
MREPLPPLPYSWAQVKHRLQQDLTRVLERLGIYDQPKNGLITPLNPTRADRHPGSFVIWTAGEAVGAWKDYATGDEGDLFMLIMYLGRLQRRIDAYWWALDHLGLARGEVRTKEQDAQDRDRIARDRAAAAAKEAKKSAEKSASLFKLWLGLPEGIIGTPAERYLREARGLPIEQLPYPIGALRWARDVEWIDPETGEVKTWSNVMMAAVTKGAKVIGLHRTFLKPDGSGKAPGKAKFMIGPTAGGAIRLTKGKGGLTPGEAEKKGARCPLILGEGIETTLTPAIARPDYRAWAAGSLDHMALIEWPECASAVVLLRDNDWAPEAQRAFEKVHRHWEKQGAGRPVAVVSSTSGSDLNDMVRGVG